MMNQRCSNSHGKSRQKLVEKFQESEKFSSLKSPWPDEAAHLKVNSKHEVWLYSSEFKFPLSRVALMFDPPSEREKYEKLFNEIRATYTAVKKSSTQISHEFDTGQYAVAWISAKKRFYRVKLVREGDDPGTHFARLLDTGKMAIVEEDDLYLICKEYLELRPRVTEVYLEGLERFDYCRAMLKLVQGIAWDTMEAIEFTVTQVVKKKIYGNLRFVDGRRSINMALLYKYWDSVESSQLPEVGESYLQGRIVHAESNGNIVLQVISPNLLALQDYCSKAQAVCQAALSSVEGEQQEMVLANGVSPGPHEIYMVADNKRGLFVRAKTSAMVDGDGGDHSEMMTFKAMDFGATQHIQPDSVLLASKVYPLLSKIPPHCIEARLFGVDQIDNMERFTMQYCWPSLTAPILIMRVSTKSGSHLPEVMLFRSQKDQLICINKEIISFRIGTPASIEMKFKIKQLLPVPQLEQIRMIDGTIWSDQVEMQLRKGFEIPFRIFKIISESELVIQTIRGTETIEAISGEIEKYVKLPYVVSTLNRQQGNPVYLNWFYAYYSREKKLWIRVRVSKILPVERAKVLMVDFAEYAEVFSRDLVLALPLKVCRIGPQALRVKKVGSEISKKEFSELEGKIGRAEIILLSYDESQMTIVELGALDFLEYESLERIFFSKVHRMNNGWSAA